MFLRKLAQGASSLIVGYALNDVVGYFQIYAHLPCCEGRGKNKENDNKYKIINNILYKQRGLYIHVSTILDTKVIGKRRTVDVLSPAC